MATFLKSHYLWLIHLGFVVFAGYRKHALDAFWLIISTAVKLTSGVLVFLILARALGVEDFGRLMFSFALANFSALPVNFGLTIFFLREGARTEDFGAEIIPLIFGLRVVVALIVAVLSALVCWIVDFKSQVYFLFFIVALIDVSIELFLARLRLGARYKKEMHFSVIQSCLQILIVSFFCFVFTTPEMVAAGFLVSKVIALFFAGKEAQKMSAFRLAPRFKGSLQLVRQSVANFIDFFIQSSLVYIDVILLGVLAGATQVGLYQAAMKIVQGLSQGISILVNLILPRITRRMDLSGWSAKDVYLVYLIFMLSGGLLSMGMYFSAEFVEQELLAGKFYGLSELVGGLSIFLFIRYLGAAGGMLLIANGDKKIRPVVMSIAVTLVSISALYFVGNQGALGMVYSMVLTYTFIAASLLGCVLIAVRRRPRF